MTQFGLIGHPLEHSFSQRYFTEFFNKEGFNFRYDNYDIESVDQFICLFNNNPDLKGLNVTSPYKETIIPYLDGYDTIVDEIKSTNTLLRLQDGRIIGFNTDVIGFATTLQQAFTANTLPSSALILGTGGASKAVQYVLHHQGIPYLLVSRDPQRGDLTYSTLSANDISDHRLIINCTPLGTFPKVQLAPDLPYDTITADHQLIDLVYNPEETLFLKNGKARGATTVNGLTMLYAQAAASWQIWQTPFEKMESNILFKGPSR